jgi:16S rRNA (guanine527-N7)-methyltransferase
MITAYRELLLHWNARVNLTAARTADEIDEHIADCRHLLDHIPPALPLRLVDVGSGGGLPAVLIAIERPLIAVTAIEPTHKKHAFLRTAARSLSLPNLAPLAERWEDHARRDYDLATSRATFDLATWLDIGAQLVHPGGRVLAMEGRDQLAPLPPSVIRHPYAFGAKTRAILVKNT